MATDKVDIAETNAISASQMSEFFRLAAKHGSHVNRETFQMFLEWKPLFLEPGTNEFLRLARTIDEIRIKMGVSDKQFRTLWTPEGRPYLERMIAGLVDTIIRVDRSIRPVYPNWAKTIMHPELEATGPAEYDLFEVEPWLHEGQKNGQHIAGYQIYKYLKEQKMLKSCLSLRDGEEIRKKGPTVFQKVFGDREILLWKSVVQHRDNRIAVPYIRKDRGEMGGDWLGLSEIAFGKGSVTPRFTR